MLYSGLASVPPEAWRSYGAPPPSPGDLLRRRVCIKPVKVVGRWRARRLNKLVDMAWPRPRSDTVRRMWVGIAGPRKYMWGARGSAVSWNHGHPCGLQPAPETTVKRNGARSARQCARTTWMSTSWAHICVCSTRNMLYLLHVISVATQYQKRR
jgi:hypothetical protein